jgi:hypothetical protein
MESKEISVLTTQIKKKLFKKFYVFKKAIMFEAKYVFDAYKAFVIDAGYTNLLMTIHDFR